MANSNRVLDVEVKIRLSAQMDDYLDELCELWGFNKSQAIRWCIQNTMFAQKQAVEVARDVIGSNLDKM